MEVIDSVVDGHLIAWMDYEGFLGNFRRTTVHVSRPASIGNKCGLYQIVRLTEGFPSATTK